MILDLRFFKLNHKSKIINLKFKYVSNNNYIHISFIPLGFCP